MYAQEQKEAELNATPTQAIFAPPPAAPPSITRHSPSLAPQHALSAAHAASAARGPDEHHVSLAASSVAERACGGQESLGVAAWVDDKITHMAHEVGDVIKEEMGGMWQVSRCLKLLLDHLI